MKTQHKIIAIPLVVMLFACSLGILVIEFYLEKQLLEGTKNELQDLAATSLEAAKSLEEAKTTSPQSIPISLQELARNIAKTAKVRVTYIDANGRVLADSEINFEHLANFENHIDREEIQAALETGKGTSQRYSKSVEQDMLYTAVRSNETPHINSASNLPHPLIARVSRPLFMVNKTIYDLRKTLLSMSLLSLLIVLALGLLGSRILARVIQREQQLLENRVDIRTTEISILQTLGSLLNACYNLQEAGEVMSNVIPKLLPGLKGSTYIIKSSRNRLDLIANWGGDWPGMEKFSPTDCWALRKGHQHLSKEHGIQTTCSHWLEPLQLKTLCIPLLAQGETIGTLHFVAENETHLEEFQHLWSAISEQVGLTLANIQLRDNLREQAIRDPLTGLFNRRYMLEALNQAQSRAERTGDSIAILMMDLDHFKHFNDNFGHDAGDHVLKAAAQVMKDSLRQEDIACRYGGEEFCIVLPAANESQAMLIAERIAKGIRTLELTMNQLSLGSVTISIGIAVFPECAEIIKDTIKAADEALYQAKQNGRDRIEVTNMTCIENNKAEASVPEIKSA